MAIKLKDMTNEEKAEEIIQVSDTKYVYDIVDYKSLEIALKDDLMEMAKWKDEQMKSTLVDFMGYLTKRGFFCDGLCFDTEHHVDTFIELQNKNR